MRFEKQQLESAYEAYRHEPSKTNAKALWKQAGLWLMTERTISCVGPCLAIFDVFEQRGQIRGWASRALMFFVLRRLRSKLGPDRPGWNDYFMCRWQLEKDQKYAKEIHRRTHFNSISGTTNGSVVGFTAQWMADSQRRQDAEFDRALSLAELNCFSCVPKVVQ